MHQLLTLQSFQTAELLCGTFRECKMLCTPIFQSQSTTEREDKQQKGGKLQVYHTEHSLAVRFKRWTRQSHVYAGLKSQQQTTEEAKETKAKHGAKTDNTYFWTRRLILNEIYPGCDKLFEIYQSPLPLNQGLDLTVRWSARIFRYLDQAPLASLKSHKGVRSVCTSLKAERQPKEARTSMW